MNAGSSHVLTGRYPELGSEPIPIEPYISPQYFELEKKYLFKKVWIHVGRVEEIPNAATTSSNNWTRAMPPSWWSATAMAPFTRSTTCVRTA